MRVQATIIATCAVYRRVGATWKLRAVRAVCISTSGTAMRTIATARSCSATISRRTSQSTCRIAWVHGISQNAKLTAGTVRAAHVGITAAEGSSTSTGFVVAERFATLGRWTVSAGTVTRYGCVNRSYAQHRRHTRNRNRPLPRRVWQQPASPQSGSGSA